MGSHHICQIQSRKTARFWAKAESISFLSDYGSPPLDTTEKSDKVGFFKVSNFGPVFRGRRCLPPNVWCQKTREIDLACDIGVGPYRQLWQTERMSGLVRITSCEKNCCQVEFHSEISVNGDVWMKRLKIATGSAMSINNRLYCVKLDTHRVWDCYKGLVYIRDGAAGWCRCQSVSGHGNAVNLSPFNWSSLQSVRGR